METKIYENKRVYVKFRLELVDSNFMELSEKLKVHRNTLASKLDGKTPTTEAQKEIINKHIGLTKKEAKHLWETKAK